MNTTHRRARIKDLFHRALELPAADRVRFLAKACMGDLAIREEVESLIFAHETGDNFLEVPAYELAADMLASDRPELTPGERLGPYTILSSLGFGGMGEVYLAQDVRLDRKIALKLLAPEFARDERRVHRFEQEARAASALNHPNVCVIHEIAKTEDGRHFMAMEFIDGMTLRVRLAQKKLTLQEVLDVGVQIAGALEAAHSAGIVHRDIKPENIMLRQDGYVKVLDFGIAKLNANTPRLRSVHEAETVAPLHTAPGTLMGTTKYMSPEQLRELPVDQRSDIWSLGVVLHEMVTGFTPFEARTTNETIAVILEKQPPRLRFHTDQVPEEFQQLVRKALSKNRSERYQTISQLGSDLRKLRRLISVDGPTREMEPSTLTLETTAGSQRGDKSGEAVSTILSRFTSQAISTADYVLSEIRQHKTAVFTGVTAVFALLFLGLSAPGRFNLRWLTGSSPTMRTRPMRALTTSGKSVCAAISPDGKSVAHAEEKDGLQELLLASIDTPGKSILMRAGKFYYRGLTFSPDSKYLYFTASVSKQGAGALYRMALPGGPYTKVTDSVDGSISFSPNGDRFSFVRLEGENPTYHLMIAGANGSGERPIATRTGGNRFSTEGPAWSPDGRTIVCGTAWWDGGHHMNLVEFDVESSQEKPVGEERWFSILQVAWLKDKSGLIISAREQPTAPFQLWKISYPEGDSSRITDDLTEYRSVSLAQDTIVSVRLNLPWDIWVVGGEDLGHAKLITSGGGLNYGLAWTARGKIVFSSMARDNLNLSHINPDGSEQSQLTNDARDNYNPATCDDGRIVFASNRNGSFNIWRINGEDGSDARQLTFHEGNFYPSCSPDGQWVFYDNLNNTTFSVWKVPMDGGTPVRLTEHDKYARMPVVSPDAQFLACRYRLEGGLLGVAILPAHGGPPVKLLPIPIMDWQKIQWIDEGRALSYIDTTHGVSNIWSYDIANGATKQLTNFQNDQIFAYAWSPDYKQIACQRGTRIGDVTLIDNQE